MGGGGAEDDDGHHTTIPIPTETARSARASLVHAAEDGTSLRGGLSEIAAPSALTSARAAAGGRASGAPAGGAGWDASLVAGFEARFGSGGGTPDAIRAPATPTCEVRATIRT